MILKDISLLVAICTALLFSSNLYASSFITRVIDVGAGLCIVVKAPDGNMVYDTGRWDNLACSQGVTELLGTNAEIDLLVLSHSDSDHLGNADQIILNHKVKHIIRTGYPRTTGTWQRFNTAVSQEVANGASVTNLLSTPIDPGTTFKIGEAQATFVFGVSEWEESNLDLGEIRNVISIVMKLEYAGKSLLLTGDTIGRGRNDPESVCKEAEKLMVDNAINVPIDTDVLIAAHHGANNASSPCFITATSPDFVIFSAGHAHNHPRKAVAKRFTDHGVDKNNIFRTDLGDDTGPVEWEHGSIEGCVDKSGDDTVEITISVSGELSVEYIDDDFESCGL